MDERWLAAIQRLKDKRDFRHHLGVYVAVNPFLVVVWAMSGYGYFWPVWPIAGWGIGLALQGWHAYGIHPITEEAILREMERGDAT